MDWCGKQQQLHGGNGWGGAAMKSSCDSTTVDRETEGTNLFRSRGVGTLCTQAQRHTWPKFKGCMRDRLVSMQNAMWLMQVHFASRNVCGSGKIRT